jgi:hypothetical protein
MGVRMWTGLMWLWVGSIDEFLLPHLYTFLFHKRDMGIRIPFLYEFNCYQIHKKTDYCDSEQVRNEVATFCLN